MASILITGAAGFIGSAMTLDLARDHRLIALDKREPAADLRATAPNVEWHRIDVADASAVRSAFQSAGTIDFVIHLAAYYHFGLDQRSEYERTNIQGTRNVAAVAADSHARRLIFASSLAALKFSSPGVALTEDSACDPAIPYGASKTAGEQIVREFSEKIPIAILRIGAVFSDWCELPLLHSLVKLWSARGMMGRVIPGRGETALPFIHIADFIHMIRAVIGKHETLARLETFLASQHGAITHLEIFRALKAQLDQSAAQPLHIPTWCARNGLRMQRALGRITGNMPYEQPWMLEYVDVPMVADTTRTRATLKWDCRPEFGLLARMPQITEKFLKYRDEWETRNLRRLESR